MGVNPLAELSVLLVDVRLHGRAEPPLDGRRRPDRRARLPDGRGQRRPRARTRSPAASRPCSATSCSARRWPSQAGGRGRPRRPPTSCTCSPCTGCCTCSATTTPSRTRSGRCSRCRPSSSTAGAASARSGERACQRRPRLILHSAAGAGRAGRLLRRLSDAALSTRVPGPGRRDGPGAAARRPGPAGDRRPTRPATSNLLLLLRLLCELTATTLVALVAVRRDRHRLAGRPDHRRLDGGGQLRRGRRRAAHHRPPARVLGRPVRRAAGALARPGAGPARLAADPDRQRVHARARASARARSRPRSSCASWSTWPSSAAWSSTASAT